MLNTTRDQYNSNTSFGSIFCGGVHTISLSLRVFDQKLDNSEHNVIKSLNIKVIRNTSYRKHVKH